MERKGGEAETERCGGSGGQGQGTWTSTSGLAAEKTQSASASDHHSCLLSGGNIWSQIIGSPPPPSPSPSPWDEDKSAVSVCPPYMRFAANCFFYSTLPLLFLLFHPSPHSPTHTTHCIHIFKCKIKLLLCSLAFLSPLNPLPCCVIYYFPFSLDISARTLFQ